MEFMQSEVTIEGSVIDDKQHGALLQVLVSKGNPELRDPFHKNIVRLENLFDLQDIFIEITNKPS